MVRLIEQDETGHGERLPPTQPRGRLLLVIGYDAVSAGRPAEPAVGIDRLLTAVGGRLTQIMEATPTGNGLQRLGAQLRTLWSGPGGR